MTGYCNPTALFVLGKSHCRTRGVTNKNQSAKVKTGFSLAGNKSFPIFAPRIAVNLVFAPAKIRLRLPINQMIVCHR
jgi:hypothetical protein